MAVRGLGCPVRFTLTAGQKGDAPQAAALIEGLPAEVVMADTAYDADHLRKAIAANRPYLIDVDIAADINPAGAGVWELPGLGRSKPGIGTQFEPT